MNNTEKDKIAKSIKDARIRKGYSQQQLADLTQLNLRSVQRIEKAEVLPRAYNLNLLAKHLDLDMEVLEGPKNNVQAMQFAIPKQADISSKKTGKMILSITLGLLIIFLSAAFLAQASKFPETSFELFLFLAFIIAVNGLIFWRIWGN
uniref:helix-turn-helix domain-containing protein n=1 Tax=Pedobacter schmidteae TaxID=2201271 RepID=UPI000EB2B304|nr:helix-turn-helix domain-containing protein [Pedobacter schmidteae]